MLGVPLLKGSSPAELIAQQNMIANAINQTQSQSIGQRLRSLAAASESNPYAQSAYPVSNAQNPAWLKANAWAISTAYQVGTVVSNGGQLYLAINSGTSAGSGGPTGTGVLIADGTMNWEFFGPAAAASSIYAPAYTFTTSAPSGITTRYGYDLHPEMFKLSGGIPMVWAGLPTYYTVGCAPLKSAGANGYNFDNNFGHAEFYSDAPKIAIAVGNGSTPVIIMVDGAYLFDGSVTQPTAGMPTYHVLDFTATSGRRTRRYQVFFSANIRWQGVYVTAIDRVWPVVRENAARALIFGSSIEAGGNGLPSYSNLLWPHQFCARAGISDPWSAAVGGTGFVNAGTAYTFGNAFQQLLSPTSPPVPGFSIAGTKFDIVIVGGAINDAASPAASITAAAVALYQAIRTQYPQAVILQMGTWAASTGPSAAILAAENATLAAVQQFNDPLTFFCPWATDPVAPWIFGTGRDSATNGSGNSDVYVSSDGTHPTNAGTIYTAARVYRWYQSQVLTNNTLDKIFVGPY